MLDVVLYGYDRRGLLALEQRRFADLRELSSFFSESPEAANYRWAEIKVRGVPGRPNMVHFTANALRVLCRSSL